MAEIAFLIIAIALAAFLVALIPTLLRTRHVVKSWLRQTSWLKMLMKKFKQSILFS